MRSYLIGRLLSTQNITRISCPNMALRLTFSLEFMLSIIRWKNVPAKMNCNQMKNAFEIRESMTKKCSRKFTIIDCFLWLCTASVENKSSFSWVFFLLFLVDSVVWTMRNRRKRCNNSYKKINQSHYSASFAYVRSLFLSFSIKISAIELIWCICIAWQKTFNLLLNGWPLMCISTILFLIYYRLENRSSS